MITGVWGDAEQVASRIGVASLRSRMVLSSADSMQLGLHTAEAFGQSESLTTRLKHIIEVYADGPGILMELVQNADDAGASEVAFLLDRRTHPANSILGSTPVLLCSLNWVIFTPRGTKRVASVCACGNGAFVSLWHGNRLCVCVWRG